MLPHYVVVSYCIVLYCIVSSPVASLRFTSRSFLVRRITSHPSHLISIHPIPFHYVMSYVASRSVASRHVISYSIGYEFFNFQAFSKCPHRDCRKQLLTYTITAILTSRKAMRLFWKKIWINHFNHIARFTNVILVKESYSVRMLLQSYFWPLLCTNLFTKTNQRACWMIG